MKRIRIKLLCDLRYAAPLLNPNVEGCSLDMMGVDESHFADFMMAEYERMRFNWINYAY